MQGDITYEIREGDTWDSGLVIATGLQGTSYNQLISTTGIKYYWIKAKGKYSTYSINPTLSVLIIQEIPSMNLVVTFDLLNPQGTLDNVRVYNNKLKLVMKE